MPDRDTVDRRVRDRRKSIPLTTGPATYQPNQRYLVIPQNLSQDFHLCSATVESLDGYGCWLRVLKDLQFPSDEDLLLIAFDDEWVLTHHAKVLKRDGTRLLVDAPSLTERERSQLAPSTGRHDYRISVDLPVRVKSSSEGTENDLAPKLARLIDLSRGGMALVTPSAQSYSEGDTISVRVVSWDHSVQIDAVVTRVSEADEYGKHRLALKFPDDMSVRQREAVSTFIIQVQRREALSRSLPTESDVDPTG